MGKTIVAGGTVFGLEGVEDFYSRPITISKINSVGYDYISVSIHLDIGVEVEDARVLVDAIGPFTCYRMSALADNGVVDQRHICEDTINVFNELFGIGVPSDMALAAALTVDLDTSITPGFASQLKNLGAVLQVDNNTFESSFEIFIRGANYVGVEQMFRMFRIFGSSIINQRKAFEIASKITKKSLSSFSLVDDDSLMAVCNFLSVCETEVAAELKKPVSKRKMSPMRVLGLTKKKVNNALSRIGYLNSDVVTGTLNYDAIDENTHKKLGFSGHDIFYKDIHPDFNYEKILEVSGKEVKPLNKEEKNSLTFFTSNDYGWFNGVLYKNMPPNDEASDKNKTSEGIKRIVSHMDSALAKAPKKQRTVYRGVSGNSQLFFGTTVHDWVDKNMVVGKDVIFDGYQSSSPNLQSANAYKGSYGGGLLYEIITPEGINVSEISMYPGEQEVILPRDARYAVVGVQKKENDVAIVQLIAVNSKGEILDGTNADPPKDISYIDKIAEEKEMLAMLF